MTDDSVDDVELLDPWPCIVRVIGRMLLAAVLCLSSLNLSNCLLSKYLLANFRGRVPGCIEGFEAKVPYILWKEKNRIRKWDYFPLHLADLNNSEHFRHTNFDDLFTTFQQNLQRFAIFVTICAKTCLTKVCV